MQFLETTEELLELLPPWHLLHAGVTVKYEVVQRRCSQVVRDAGDKPPVRAREKKWKRGKILIL